MKQLSHFFLLFFCSSLAHIIILSVSNSHIAYFMHRNILNQGRVFSRQRICRHRPSFLSSPAVRTMSTTGPVLEPEDDVAYIGTFGGTLKLLRRVSLCSATLSITSLPMMMVLHNTTPSLPQLIVIGTAVTASLGSTMFLKLMSFPYVTKLEEISNGDMTETSFHDRRFMAYRLSMLGTEYGTEVCIKDVEPVKVTDHPFSSFKAKGDKFFIFHKSVKEEKLQSFLLEVQERKTDAKAAAVGGSNSHARGPGREPEQHK